MAAVVEQRKEKRVRKMNEKQKRELRARLRAGLEFILISLLWGGLEIFLYRESRGSLEDTIISLILYYYIEQCELRKLDLL